MKTPILNTEILDTRTQITLRVAHVTLFLAVFLLTATGLYFSYYVYIDIHIAYHHLNISIFVVFSMWYI